MKTYDIYDMQTGNYIGMVEANDVIQAEIIASAEFNHASDQLYALTSLTSNNMNLI
jgi:hypothetical protein